MHAFILSANKAGKNKSQSLSAWVSVSQILLTRSDQRTDHRETLCEGQSCDSTRNPSRQEPAVSSGRVSSVGGVLISGALTDRCFSNQASVPAAVNPHVSWQTDTGSRSHVARW